MRFLFWKGARTVRFTTGVIFILGKFSTYVLIVSVTLDFTRSQHCLFLTKIYFVNGQNSLVEFVCRQPLFIGEGGRFFGWQHQWFV